jgi:uncharacterized protein (DUF427 family)
MTQSARNPNHKVTFASTPKRVRAMFAGQTVADSTDALLLRETRHVPVYYFPRTDVRMDLLTPTDRSTHCPYKGDASYWHVAVDGRVAENAAWSYETPFDDVAGMKDYVAFYWNRMDSWWEEDEEVFVHARDPFVRVDVLASRRRVTVTAGGKPLADSTRALFLFETGHPVRYYIPPEDVKMDRLAESEHVTACPYKGTAHYFSLKDGNDEVAWVYADPIAEVARIADHLCFYPDKVDSIEVAPPAKA